MQLRALLSISPFIALSSAALLPVTTTTSGTYNATETTLAKRQGTGVRITWYDVSVGLTACGGLYSNSDFVVALNQAQFGTFPSPQCGRQISISSEGKTATATIVDDCPGCPFGGLDLSEGLFTVFADPSVGVLSGNWNFV